LPVARRPYACRSDRQGECDEYRVPADGSLLHQLIVACPDLWITRAFSRAGNQLARRFTYPIFHNTLG
jgi:hypothetical protein